MTDFPAPEDALAVPGYSPSNVSEGGGDRAPPSPRKVYESNLLPDRRGSRHVSRMAFDPACC